MDEVVVIIPTFNSAKYLAESVESIINQTWKNIKIYILDGG
jgi:glycosyltransferase involved in cell wall biosynthesis